MAPLSSHARILSYNPGLVLYPAMFSLSPTLDAMCVPGQLEMPYNRYYNADH